jgi:hypothetical protein
MGARIRWAVGAFALIASLAVAASAHASPSFTTPVNVSPKTDGDSDSLYSTKAASDGAGNTMVAWSHFDYSPDYTSYKRTVEYVTRAPGGSFSSVKLATPSQQAYGSDLAMNKRWTCPAPGRTPIRLRSR